MTWCLAPTPAAYAASYRCCWSVASSCWCPFGLAQGLWLANLHNGLLGLAFALVGAYVLYQRPGHREGRLFLLTGGVEAVMFFGRQVGHFGAADTGRWWGWLGVWPTAVALALTTLSVICFPDGRFAVTALALGGCGGGGRCLRVRDSLRRLAG